MRFGLFEDFVEAPDKMLLAGSSGMTFQRLPDRAGGILKMTTPATAITGGTIYMSNGKKVLRLANFPSVTARVKLLDDTHLWFDVALVGDQYGTVQF